MFVMLTNDHQTLAQAFAAAARDAGLIGMPWFRPGAQATARVDYKDGGSPVTEADLAIDRYLFSALRQILPGAAWLSEETADNPARLDAEHVIIVDPIDGTRGFVAGDDRWCISMAVVSHGRPVIGVLHAPARNEMVIAVRDSGATLNGTPLAIHARGSNDPWQHAGPLHVAKGHARLANRAIESVPKVPSLAYRLLMVAKGEIASASASPDSHDWDIAAADLILSEAGGRLVAASGRVPVYNQPTPRHPALLAAHASLF
jgi:myo-inositol-1(or 4)-monophosphatase